MSWETVHHYAEDIELWTSLAVNLWLIAGGIIFGWHRLWGLPEKPINQQVIAAAREALYMVAAAAGMAGMLLVGTNKSPFRAEPFTIGVGLICFSSVVIVTYFDWMGRRRKPPKL